MPPLFEDGFLIIPAQTRFSDFSPGGTLHFSRCLMYFEKGRFEVSRVSGLREIIGREFPQGDVAFVVARVDIRYLKPVALRDGETDARLDVRTRLLPPTVAKLSFDQRLTDAETGETLIRAVIDVAVLAGGRTVTVFSPACAACLKAYCEAADGGNAMKEDRS